MSVQMASGWRKWWEVSVNWELHRRVGALVGVPLLDGDHGPTKTWKHSFKPWLVGWFKTLVSNINLGIITEVYPSTSNAPK